jgi:hypothetical protein
MVIARCLLVSLLFLVVIQSVAQKPRLIVTTDIGQDPDDEQSMVRLLHYACDFTIEGLIANADANEAHESPVVKDTIIHKMINAYSKIVPQLRVHNPDYPNATYLHSVVKRGCAGNAVGRPHTEFIGDGLDTPGSEWIIEVVDRHDPQPVNIAVWGGAADLAQALWKVKNTRSAEACAAFVAKLRVFFIGKQDSSNDWILNTFPKLWVVLALDRGGDKWESGYRGMFWGGDMRMTSREWLEKNIKGKNPLADLYPTKAFTGGEKRNPHMAMKEGDSPSFLYFIPNGLNAPDHPSWGGWGGRYSLMRDNVFGDADDSYFDLEANKMITSPRATVFRWRQEFQNDFAARVLWASQSLTDANHRPNISINGEQNLEVLFIVAKPGDHVKLNATATRDPDGDELRFSWYDYPEAGTYKNILTRLRSKGDGKCVVEIPADAAGKSIHIILAVTDKREVSLTAYKRIVIEVK